MFTNKTFRIFISSTFTDMESERNHLQKKVFPKLKKLCMNHGYRFQAIDLRWGVTEEAGFDQQTMKICFEEIKRCQEVTPRPNFLILLGNKYGWRPLPYQIPENEFNIILKQASPNERRLLLWNEEKPKISDGWYQKDENALPNPIYLLRPRNGSYENYKCWEPIEEKLRTILAKYASKLNLEFKDNLKYYASATEQEIMKGLTVEDAAEHVFGFFREIDDLPPNESAANYLDITKNGKINQDSHKRIEYLKNKLEKKIPGNIKKYESQWNNGNITTEHLKKFGKDVYQALSQVIIKEIEKYEEIDSYKKEKHIHEKFINEMTKNFVGRSKALGKIRNYFKSSSNQILIVHGDSGTGKSALMAKATQEVNKNNSNTAIVRFLGLTPRSSNPRSLLKDLCKQIYQSYGLDKSFEELKYSELLKSFQESLSLANPDKPLFIFLDALDQLSNIENSRQTDFLPNYLPENVFIVVSTLATDNLLFLRSLITTKNFLHLKDMNTNNGKKLLNLWLKKANRTLQPYQIQEIMNKFSLEGKPLYLKLVFEDARNWKSYSPLKKLKPTIDGVILDFINNLASESHHGNVLVSRCLGFLVAAKNGLTEDEILYLLSHDEVIIQDFLRRSRHRSPEDKFPIVLWSRLYLDLKPYLTKKSADETSLLVFYHNKIKKVIIKEFLSSTDKSEFHKNLSKYFSKLPLYTEKGNNVIYNLRKLSELPYHQSHGEMWDDIENTLTDMDFITAKCQSGNCYDLLQDYNLLGLGIISGPPIITARFYNHQFGILCPFCNCWSKVPENDLDSIISCPVCKKFLKLNKFFINYKWQVTDFEAEIELNDDFLEVPSSVLLSDFAYFIQREIDIISRYPQDIIQLALNQPNDSNVRLKTLSKFKNDLKDQKWIKWVNKPEKQDLTFKMGKHDSFISSCGFSPDGSKTISGSFQELIICDAMSGKEIKRIQGHTDYINSCGFSPDGTKIISCSDDGLKIRDLKNGEIIFESLKKHFWQFWNVKSHSLSVNSCSFSPDGKIVLSGSEDSSIKIWDFNRFDLEETIKFNDKLSLQPNEMSGIKNENLTSFSPDGSFILTNLLDKKLQILEIQSGEKKKVFEGSIENIKTCNYSPDGKKIISGFADGTIKIWDVMTGTKEKIFKGSIKNIKFCAYSPDGKKIISGFADGTIKIWDNNTGQEEKLFQGEGEFTLFEMSNDGKIIIGVSKHNNISIWDLDSGKIVKSLKGHTGRVLSCSFSPDGSKIVLPGENNEIKIWDLDSGKIVKSLKGHTGRVLSCSFSPEGWNIISGSKDGTLKIWDIESGEEIFTYLKTSANINKCLFSHDALKILAITDKGELHIFNTDSGKKLWSLETNQEKKRKISRPFQIVYDCSFSPDCNQILSSSTKNMTIWDSKTYEIILNLYTSNEFIYNCNYSPDGKKVVSGFNTGSIKIWDSETGKRLKTLKEHSEGITACSFSPDGKKIISGSIDGTIKIWDAHSGEVIQNIEDLNGAVTCCKISPDGKRIISGDENDLDLKMWDINLKRKKSLKSFDNRALKSCTFSDDANSVIMGSENCISQWNYSKNELKVINENKNDCYEFISSVNKAISSHNNVISIFDLETGKKIKTLKSPDDDFISIFSISKDGNKISSCSIKGTISIWDVKNGENFELPSKNSWKFWKSKRLSDYVNCCFSPNGKKLISCSFDGIIEIWDIKTKQKLKVLKKHENVNICHFSNDQKKIITGSADGTLKIWDIKTGKKLKTINAHKDPITTCSISIDDKNLITGSADGTLKIWDIKTGKKLKTINAHKDPITTCSFSIDGEKILSGSYDGLVNIFNVGTWEKTYSLSVKDHWTFNELKTDRGPVNSCCISSNGKLTAIGYESGEIVIWGNEDGNEIKKFKVFNDSVNTCSFSDDSKKIMGTYISGKIRIWEVESGDICFEFRIRKFFKKFSNINSSSFSPDGKEIILGFTNGEITKLNIESRHDKDILLNTSFKSVLITSLKSPAVNCCSYSLNGDKIIAGLDDGKIMVWKTGKIAPILTLIGPPSGISSCCFSRDGKKIIAGSYGGHIQLWDIETGKTIKKFLMHNLEVSNCCFSPNSSYIFSISLDKTFKIVDVEKDKIISEFIGEAPFTTMDSIQNKIVIGDLGGKFYILEVKGINI